jgi:hypothetical protein
MTEKLTDGAVLAHIQKLVQEEEALYGHGAPSDADRDRLKALNVELDRCWDLLRQRRALRDAGTDPDQAETRDADTVERYLQ